MPTWRDKAAPIVAETIRSIGREDMKALRKALRDAYPFQRRTGYAYRAWCNEVAAQLGHPLRAPARDKNQKDLFHGSAA